jgi:hypothetical protein
MAGRTGVDRIRIAGEWPAPRDGIDGDGPWADRLMRVRGGGVALPIRNPFERRDGMGHVDGRSVAWVSYLPIPGIALVAALAARHDRLARFHALQGGWLVALLYVALIVVGFVARASDAAWWRLAWGLVVGILLIASLFGMVWGAAGSLRGRFVRVRPVWDLLRWARK